MKQIMSVLVENKAGVLSRTAGLFARRGFNIESLAVGETEDPTVSRMTIVVEGDERTIEQVEKQLNKQIDVIKVKLLETDAATRRELILIKTNATQQNRGEVIDIATIMNAKIVDLSRAFLNSNGAVKYTDVEITAPREFERLRSTAPMKEKWTAMMENLNVCSQKGLVERFDSTIGAGTVLLPFGGVRQLTPAQAMAAKIPVLHGETTTASLMGWGFNPDRSAASPYHGAVCAVVESVAKVVAAGGAPEDSELAGKSGKEALDAIHFKLPFAKVTPWVVLAFLALVVVLMCFSASYRVAVIAGVIWLAILFAAYQITQAKR